MSLIVNAANVPISQQNSSVPDVSGAMQSYYQSMTFVIIKKQTVNFQLIETPFPIDFFGNIQPLSPQRLMMKPEGQRQWKWFLLHAQPRIILKPDDVFVYLNTQYRCMSKMDYTLYGYIQYELVQDYTGGQL